MMIKKSLPFVRNKMIDAQPFPFIKRGIFFWFKKNLFSSFIDGLVSFILLGFISFILFYLTKWLFFDAVWEGTDRRFCSTQAQGGFQNQDWSGACWAFVKANFGQIIFGSYPYSERWRVVVTALLAIMVNIPLFIPTVRYKFLNAIASLFLLPLIGWILLYGGAFGLTVVQTQLWGGLMVTIVIAYSSIALSLPLGTFLALGRRSRVLFIRWGCTIFIETLRGVPLVALLFFASVMFPLFLPEGMSIDKLLRALLGIAIFTSVYIAEVVRGGLQAIPVSQYEAAAALGLPHRVIIFWILLPQAYQLVIPGIINVLIGMVKETSLVYIISMYDLLGILRLVSMQPNWITPQTPATAFAVAAAIFWILCFALSCYARFIENYMKRSL